MSNYELINVVGGASSYTTGAFLNSLVRVLNTFLEIGRSIGSAINYTINKRVC